MFSESINDNSIVVGILTVGDATTWSVTYNCHFDNSRVIVYNRNLFSIQATGPEKWLWQSHRHLSNIDCLIFVMCPLIVLVLIGFFSSFLLWLLTVLMKQIRQAVYAIQHSIIFRCLWAKLMNSMFT